MKAIILAGGQATRLRPITHNLPKCLLVIGGKTILDFQIEALHKNKVNDVIIVTGFKADMLKTHVQKHYPHPQTKFTFVHNNLYETTRAAYGLWVARDHLDDTVIYLNADLLCDPQILEMVISSPKESITAIQKNKWDEEEVNVIVNSKLEVIEIGKLIPEETSYGEFIGATKLSRSFVKKMVGVLDTMVTQGDTQRFAVDAINATIQEGETLHTLDVTDYTAIEIDTIEDFENGKKLWKKYETR